MDFSHVKKINAIYCVTKNFFKKKKKKKKEIKTNVSKN